MVTPPQMGLPSIVKPGPPAAGAAAAEAASGMVTTPAATGDSRPGGAAVAMARTQGAAPAHAGGAQRTQTAARRGES
jgi:hypothetical protein